MPEALVEIVPPLDLAAGSVAWGAAHHLRLLVREIQRLQALRARDGPEARQWLADAAQERDGWTFTSLLDPRALARRRALMERLGGVPGSEASPALLDEFAEAARTDVGAYVRSVVEDGITVPNERPRLQAVRYGAEVPALLAKLVGAVRPPAHADAAKEACEALARALERSTLYDKEAAVHCGAVHVTADALRGYLAHARVTAAACRVMYHLTRRTRRPGADGFVAEDRAIHVLIAEHAHALPAAMSWWPRAVAVQADGMAALHHLLQGAEERALARVLPSQAAVPALDAVVAAMHHHRDHPPGRDRLAQPVEFAWRVLEANPVAARFQYKVRALMLGAAAAVASYALSRAANAPPGDPRAASDVERGALIVKRYATMVGDGDRKRTALHVARDEGEDGRSRTLGSLREAVAKLREGKDQAAAVAETQRIESMVSAIEKEFGGP